MAEETAVSSRSSQREKTTPNAYTPPEARISRHDALITFASQSGFEILFGANAIPKDMLRTVGSEGITELNDLTIETSLERLLKGSHLHYTIHGKQIRISRAENDTHVTQLPRVTVQGYLRDDTARIRYEEDDQEQFPLYQIPFSIQSASREYMDEMQALSSGDVMSYIAGIEYFGQSGGVHPQYYSRGISTAYSIDGKLFRRTVLIVDPGVLERIDLIQGPSANYLSPGGLLNFVTKKPKKGSRYEVALTGGSYDFYRTVLDINIATKSEKKQALRLIGIAETKKNFKDFVFQDKLVLAPSFEIEFSESSQILLSMYHQRRKGSPNKFTFHKSVLGRKLPKEQTLGLPWAESSIKDTNISAEYNNSNWNNWQITTGVNWHYFQGKSKTSTILAPIDDQENSPVLYGFDEGSFVKYYGGDCSAERGISFFGKSSVLRIGVEFEHFNQYYPTYPDRIVSPPFFNIRHTNYAEIEEPSSPDSVGLTRQQSDYLAIYFTQSIYLSDVFTVHADVRYENLSATGRLVDQRINLDWRVDTLYKELTPHVGINASFTDSFSSHISYSESFTHQDILDSSKINNPLVIETMFVSPIKNQQIEIAFKKTWRDNRLSSNLTFYHLKRSNIQSLAFSPTDSFTNPDVDGQFSKGAILDINGSPTPNLHIMANISANDNTIATPVETSQVENFLLTSPSLNSANQGRGTAKLIANTWISYNVRSGILKNFRFGLGVKYVGERYGDNDNSFVLPSYTKFDALVEFKPSDDLTISLTIRNTSNKEYYAGSLGSNLALEEGEPRSVFLTVKSKGLF